MYFSFFQLHTKLNKDVPGGWLSLVTPLQAVTQGSRMLPSCWNAVPRAPECLAGSVASLTSQRAGLGGAGFSKDRSTSTSFFLHSIGQSYSHG